MPKSSAKKRGLHPKEKTLPKSRYGPWRAATLTLVYVLMIAHIVHWLIAGKTLVPLELNEVMYTFELGIITAGFLLMALALLATAIFGRFFCSWGCHILALQDLCSWLLEKVRIRPIGIRSRLLLWTPIAVAFYMFAWPQVVRVWEGRPLPILHLRSDDQGWASFVTENFWRNLPTPGVALVTFAVCGFVIVYIMGSRAFCNYGCPYGAVFGIADRIAPGKIRVGDDCTQCGACTSVCSSHIRVHEELNRYGMVVNPACMKDLDCVSACSQQSLHYGFGRPSLARQIVGDAKVQKRYDFAFWEEVVMVAVLLGTLVIYRGLYELIPFFLAIALGTLLAYFSVVTIRLVRNESVKLNRWQLKHAGRLSQKGWLFTGMVTVLGIATVHSAVIRYHLLQGRRYYQHVEFGEGGPASAIGSAIRHLELANRRGLFTSASTDPMLAGLYMRQERWSDAQWHLARIVNRGGGNVRIYNNLARSFAQQERYEEAERMYRASLNMAPKHAQTYYAMAGMYFETRRPNEAVANLRQAVEFAPEFAEAHYDLGAVLIELRDFDGGIGHLKRAIEINPDYADAHYNLAVALAMTNKMEAAMREIEVAAKLNPRDEKTIAFRQHLRGLRAGG